jgi:pimeloyl-ACP methyl ester carboxylesterase
MKIAAATSTILMLMFFGAASAAPGDILYAKPGQIVSAGDGARLNLYCMGAGSPSVIFDSGWEDWSPAWAIVQPLIAKWTRACSYDRAGAGFSTAGPMPRTSVRIANELHTALHNAGITGPYILVGHAFGGDNVRTFADLYTDEVAGLVLDEADPGDVEPKDMQAEDHKGNVAFLPTLRECRDAVAQRKRLPVLPLPPGQPPQTCAQQFFRGLPEEAWSAELNAKLLQLANTKTEMYDAYYSEMEQMPSDEAYLQTHIHFLGSRPVRVITTGNHGVHHLRPVSRPPSPEHLKYEQEMARAQARWLSLSTNARQVFTHNSSEYVQFDEPATLINTVREVYEQTKSGKQ